jgi:hypothetical protein
MRCRRVLKRPRLESVEEITPMNRPPETIEQVREEMRQIRSQLDEEVETFVQSTRVLFDWHSYLRRAPWLCVGAAALAGYLIVPSKPKVVSPTPQQLADLAKHSRVTIPEGGVQAKAKSLGRELAGVALGLLVRAGMSVATQQFNQFMNRPPGPSEPLGGGGPKR